LGQKFKLIKIDVGDMVYGLLVTNSNLTSKIAADS